MFIERDRRYFRRYAIRLKPRTKFAPALPLVAGEKQLSALAALRRAMTNKKAEQEQPNGDTIELIAAHHIADKGLVVLLFHRASPNAADPAYRRRIKNKITVRQTKKEADEEQAVSCHLIISTILDQEGSYPAVLEEIPGLSASTVLGIIGRVLGEYTYPYVHKKKELETTTVMRAEGVKSEKLTDALKKQGSLDYLTLTRTLPADVPDAAGIAEPQTEKIKYRIVGNPASNAWQKKFKNWVEGVKPGWNHVSVDVTLEDNRHRTVRVDTEQEASEVLFVRSELEFIDADLDPCTLEIVPAVVSAARKIMKKK